MSFFSNVWNLFSFRISMNTDWSKAGREDSDDSWDSSNLDTFKNAEEERDYFGDDMKTYWERHYLTDVRDEQASGGPTAKEAYASWESGWMTRRRELYRGAR